MGWFNKKENLIEEDLPSLPELPRLPKLPEFPETDEAESKKPVQLPRFPNNSLGKKFSQETIKEAVTGKKEGEWGGQADDFVERKRMMQKPQKNREIEERFEIEKEPEKTPKFESSITKQEPIFIRVDKFEDSKKIFEQAKEKISDIEKTLREIKELREDEEKELNSWEKEMISVKENISKIDKELFSKIE